MKDFTTDDFKKMLLTAANIEIYESAIYHIGSVLSDEKIETNRRKFDVIEKIIHAVNGIGDLDRLLD